MGLRQAYEKIYDYSLKNDIEIDSFEVVREVERLKNYWKPEKISVILLAESHVLTSDEDFKIKIDYSKYIPKNILSTIELIENMLKAYNM